MRISTSGGAGLRVTAFENKDGTVAVNMINQGGAEVTVGSIGGSGLTIKAARAWLTNNDHDMDVLDVSVGEAGVTGVKIPARGMVSVVIRK
jgi:hypothetical protein